MMSREPTPIRYYRPGQHPTTVLLQDFGFHLIYADHQNTLLGLSFINVRLLGIEPRT